MRLIHDFRSLAVLIWALLFFFFLTRHERFKHCMEFGDKTGLYAGDIISHG
jgi:hypothetical protein